MPHKNYQCIAITADGSQCSSSVKEESTRCGLHQRVLILNGPNATALLELEYKRDREIRTIMLHNEDLGVKLNLSTAAQTHYFNERQRLIDRQRQEIERTGIDPDREANERKEAKRLERNRKARERAAQQREQEWQEFRDDARNINEQHLLQQTVIQNAERDLAEQAARAAMIREAMIRQAQQRTELGRIAMDNQGVHNDTVVKMVSKTIKTILKIPVPSEYRWNMTTCSKTPGDIILKCNLSPRGAWQMSANYCQNMDIYNLGEGIYGKVLDCVWQFILTSKDSDDLMKILKREIEDNAGTCAQGNLTRLCNILGGYIEGIEVKEPTAQVLGRKLPSLFEIKDVLERVRSAYRILVEEDVPQSDWLTWLTPLINDEGDEKWYKIEIDNNSSSLIKLIEIARG